MRVLLHFLKPYKCLCFFTVLVTLIDVAGTLYIPTLAAEMINIGLETGNWPEVVHKGVCMLGAVLLSALGTLVGSFLCARLSARLGRDLRNALYDHVLAFSETDFDQFGTGSLITRTLTDVSVVQQAFTWSIQMILPVPALCLMGMGLAYSLNPEMGKLMIGVTTVILGGAVLITRKAAVIFEKLQTLLDKINVLIRENLTGVRVIRAFNKEAYEEKRLHRSFADYAESAIHANGLFFGLESLAIFVMNLCICTILWLGADQIGARQLEIGDLTALTEYAILILFYVILAQMVVILLPRAKVCLNRIGAVLAKQPEITDGKAKALPAAAPEVFRLHNVTFRFANAAEAALQNLDFALCRGKTTAIIGSTGSGKSTLAKLLLRFHDVTEGAITLEGMDIRQLTQEQLRKHISYVPQKAWLFSGTLAENLRVGWKEASQEDLKRALSIAQADFVKDLPEGLETQVSQGGTNFSGGQRQRLAIARALLKKADLYIFDDSFSALDFKTDAALRRALKNTLAGSSVLIIAQRVSTIETADQIIVLEDGRTVGVGTHQELLKGCPAYQQIVESQTKGGSCHGTGQPAN